MRDQRVARCILERLIWRQNDRRRPHALVFE